MLRECRTGCLVVVAGGWCFADVTVAADEGDTVPPEVSLAGSVRTEGERPWQASRRLVEVARRKLEIEIAELHAIGEAQQALVEYVEAGGGKHDDGLDRILCDGSALRPLCPELVETFAP